jgi:hypothetical protein
MSDIVDAAQAAADVMEKLERNSVRNPSKKPGRPKLKFTANKHIEATCGSRNVADMAMAVVRRLDKDLYETVRPLLAARATTLTVLAYVARYPHDQQAEVFLMLNRLGSRGAKRFVECSTRPPSATTIAEKIVTFVNREFPGVHPDLIAEALGMLQQNPLAADANSTLLRPPKQTRQSPGISESSDGLGGHHNG